AMTVALDATATNKIVGPVATGIGPSRAARAVTATAVTTASRVVMGRAAMIVSRVVTATAATSASPAAMEIGGTTAGRAVTADATEIAAIVVGTPAIVGISDEAAPVA